MIDVGAALEVGIGVPRIVIDPSDNTDDGPPPYRTKSSEADATG